MKPIGLQIALILAVTIPACSKKTPVDPVNASPVISALFADSTLLSVTSQTPVRCIAHDPEGDTLQYNWQSYPGAVTGSGAVISWQAPDVGGNYPLICRVRDSQGNTAEARIRFSVVGNASPVYQVLLDSMWYSPESTVILDSTIYDQISPVGFWDRTREYLFETSPELLLSTYEDYLKKNQTSTRLHDYPFWNTNYTLLPAEEWKFLFGDDRLWMANCDGWDALHAAYPNSEVLLLVSKVGFNPKREQALVYVEELYKWFGYGRFVLLSKNDTWQITRSIGISHADYLCR